MKSVKYYVGASCERPIQPAPRSVPAPRPPAPLRSIVFLPRPLTAPLRSTRFSGRSAPFSAPLTLRSHALGTGLTRTLADSMTEARDRKITDVVSDLQLFSLENDDDVDE